MGGSAIVYDLHPHSRLPLRSAANIFDHDTLVQGHAAFVGLPMLPYAGSLTCHWLGHVALNATDGYNQPIMSCQPFRVRVSGRLKLLARPAAGGRSGHIGPYILRHKTQRYRLSRWLDPLSSDPIRSASWATRRSIRGYISGAR